MKFGIDKRILALRRRRVRLLFVLVALGVFCFSAVGQETETDDAVAIFNKGQDAHEKGDLAAAIELYDRALRLAPEFPEASLQKGSALLSMGRLDDAEKSFRRAVELRPDWSLAAASLGDVLVQRRKFSEAEPVLKRAISLDKISFPAYAALVELRLKTGASRESMSELLSSIDVLAAKAKPTASVWAARAALENALGNKTETARSLGAALNIDPANRLALAQSIELAIANNDATAARSFLQRFEASSKDMRAVGVYRAKLMILEGNTVEADEILSAIKDPDSETAKLRGSIKLSTTNDTTVLEKELAADPKNAVLLGRLCSAYRTKDAMAALDFCRRALEVEPTNIGFAIGYGAALLQAKRYTEAVELLGRLKTAAPDNSTVRANLATALFQLKRYPEAKAEYRWLVDKQPELAAAYYFLAITHDQLGEYMDAMANYQQFLRIADHDASKLEIEKVNLRLPVLQKQIKDGRGKKND